MSRPRIDRRTFLEYTGVSGALGLTAPGVSPPATAPFELEEATIAELQADMTSGKYTARSLLTAYLQRIDAIDRRGPGLRSVLETNPDALAQATALDAERKAKGPRGLLHGIPILVKDNVATRDRMQSTAGSLALGGAAPPPHAVLVERPPAAAATLLGALTGVDPHDDATAASAGHPAADYSASLDPAGLKGARLGVCRSHFMGYSPGTDAVMEGAIDALKRLGAVIVDPADIATAGQFDDSEFAVLLYEFKADLNRYPAEWAPGG